MGCDVFSKPLSDESSAVSCDCQGLMRFISSCVQRKKRCFFFFSLIQVPKRKKDKVQMKEINAGTEHEYGDVNIQMTSYDMCLVEHFAQYVHKLCNQLSVRVSERYKERGSVLLSSLAITLLCEAGR